MAPLTLDQVLAGLAGHTVTVNVKEDRLVVSGAGITDDVANTLKAWKKDNPAMRTELIMHIWELARGDDAGLDRLRCPACPNRGKPVLYELEGYEVLCDSTCPSHDMRITL